MLNVPVNNFSVMLGWSHRFLGITSTFRGVNVPLLKVVIEPSTSQSGVRDSTTRTPRSTRLKFEMNFCKFSIKRTVVGTHSTHATSSFDGEKSNIICYILIAN